MKLGSAFGNNSERGIEDSFAENCDNVLRSFSLILWIKSSGGNPKVFIISWNCSPSKIYA